MPRTKKQTAEQTAPSKRTRKAPTFLDLATYVANAIASLPFDYAAESSAPHLFPNLSVPDGAPYSADEVRAGIAEQIAADRAAGLSGNDLRAKYSGTGCPVNAGLSGPMRRKVLRDFGHGSVVARSYSEYSDGLPRSGSAHARAHGPRAAERAAAAILALAAEQTDATPHAEQGRALRAAGQTVPRDPGKRADAFRALRADALASAVRADA